MECNSCGSHNLLRIHQIGVMNYQRTDNIPEPEVFYDMMICPKCGAIKIDPDTLKIKSESGIWTGMKLNEI